MSSNLDAITGLIETQGPGRILVVTGASISLASGIPTFRGQDPGAIWMKDATELGNSHDDYQWSRVLDAAGVFERRNHT